METSTELMGLAAALAKAQAEIKGAMKDSSNPFFKSSYADLESVWEAVRMPLTKNGLSIIQVTDADEFLITMLLHSSGQWIKGKLKLMPSKKDAQAYGSAITYARRYGLAAMVGVFQTDDDGELAVGRGKAGTAGPTIDDGKHDALGYRIPFGKYAQRSLEEVPMADLRNYVDYIEKKAAKENKAIVGTAAEFIEKAVEYIASFENSVQTE